jgi:IS5 family transposase
MYCFNGKDTNVKNNLHQRFQNHPEIKSKVKKADRKVRTIAGRLVGEFGRNLVVDSDYQSEI